MKRAFILIVSLIAALGFVSAQSDVDDVVAQANAAYQTGDYESAVRLYEALVAGGVRDGAVYFNLGSAYYQRDDLTHALLNFRRAQDWIPRDADLNANMALIRARRLDVQGDETGVLESMSVLTSAILTMTELGWVTFGLWTLWFALLAAAILRKSWRDFLRPVLIVLAVVTVIAVVLLGSRLYVTSNEPAAIVMDTSVHVMSGPGDDYLELFQLHTAAELRLLDANGDWVRIVIPDGRQGWIPRQSLELI